MIDVKGTYIMESAVVAMGRCKEGERGRIEITLMSGETLSFTFRDHVDCHMEFLRILSLLEAYQRQIGEICPSVLKSVRHPTVHRDECMSKHPGCLCGTCKKDELMCCNEHVPGMMRPGDCPRMVCADYEPEEVPEA